MENVEGEKKQIKLSRYGMGIEIFKIAALVVSFVMSLLALFCPCLHIDTNELSMTNEDTKFYEIAQTISADSDLTEIFTTHLEAEAGYSNKTLYMVFTEIMDKNSNGAGKAVTISYCKFACYTLKYTFFSGSGNNVLLSGLTLIGTLFIAMLALALAILGLCSIGLAVYNLIALIKNPAKINSKIYGGYSFLFYILMLIPFLLAGIPSIFAWLPTYSWYLICFKFTSVFYVTMVIEIILFIAHFIVKKL